MRRTARVLSATALAGAALGAAASAAFADPAAEVSPGSVEPGGSVTVSVTCDAIGGAPPDFIEATSQGFEDGKVQLRRIAANDETLAGAAYSGTARIPPGGGGGEHGENSVGDGDVVGPESEWDVDGACPVAPGGREKQWAASYTVARGDAPARDTAELERRGTAELERPAPVQRGVHAGEGGAFTDSLPALIAGGALITGALGAAVYRLRTRDASADR
ncbi:hypothetical protein [Streptomyces sp. NPDC050535]|uniref:hypothetical protein n=1 Tax=Streptomyces sp. NPDC050535 TaxID=3365626 RepID=UPI003788898F